MMKPEIEYLSNARLEVHDIARVFDSSGIARPTSDLARIERMFAAPSLVISAWASDKLIGVCRSLTDYAYCCYLSDLAVAAEFQGQGVGGELIRRTKALIGSEVSLILLSAPGAMTYYPSQGFEKAENAFVIRRQNETSPFGQPDLSPAGRLPSTSGFTRLSPLKRQVETSERFHQYPTPTPRKGVGRTQMASPHLNLRSRGMLTQHCSSIRQHHF